MLSVYPEIDPIYSKLIDNLNIDSDELYEFIIEKVDESHVRQFSSIQHAFEFLTNDIPRLNSVVAKPIEMEYQNPSSDDSGSYCAYSPFVEENNNNYNNNQLAHRSRPDYDEESEYIDVVGLPGKENLTVLDAYHMHHDSTFQNSVNYKTQSNDWDHIYTSRQHSNECLPVQKMSRKLPINDKPDQSKTKRGKSTSKQTNKKTTNRNSEPVYFVCLFCGQKYRRKHSFEKHEENHRNGNHPKRSRSTKKQNVLNVIVMDH